MKIIFKINKINKYQSKFKNKFGEINIFVILINEIFKYILSYNYKKKFVTEKFSHVNDDYKNKNINIVEKFKKIRKNILKKHS